MSSFGPQMPSQAPKRKRTSKEGPSPPSKHQRSESPTKNQSEIDLEDSDDDDYGPSAPAASKPPAAGPSLPPSNQDEIGLNSDSDSDTGPAPPPISMGPPPRPAAVTTRPVADDSSSDSDDDYGPAPPSASNANKPSIGPQLPPAPAAPQRDEWMLVPPPDSSYTERDPTKMKNRKFASKSSSGSTAVSSIWTETPEEKLKRLKDAVLGREDKTQEAAEKGHGRSKEEMERQQRIAASIEASRGKSLYDQHQSTRDNSKEKVEEEDDPSKRGFDREKDMALSGKIGTAQRRELMNKAANFGGRFQKGSFL
ncbi:hypothetical protein G7046_g1156 [Stylonectria norvegica]|nr:hypothetical protein G7046_g1156 [Stylonectria norvegica]